MIQRIGALLKRALGISVNTRPLPHDFAVHIHPLEEVFLHLRKEKRDRNHRHPRKNTSEVLHQTAHGHAPPRVRKMVKNHPKRTAERQTHKKDKRIQPRISKTPLHGVRWHIGHCMIVKKQQIRAHQHANNRHNPTNGDE